MIRARESKSAPVGVVAKLLRILETLDNSPAGLQLREIAQHTGINKSTAYRFRFTLCFFRCLSAVRKAVMFGR